MSIVLWWTEVARTMLANGHVEREHPVNGFSSWVTPHGATVKRSSGRGRLRGVG